MATMQAARLHEIGTVFSVDQIERPHNARNFQGQRYEGRTLVDFNAQWEFSSGLSLGAYLKNAFDLRYRTVGLDLATGCGCSLEAYGEPRTWGVTVGCKF